MNSTPLTAFTSHTNLRIGQRTPFTSDWLHRAYAGGRYVTIIRSGKRTSDCGTKSLHWNQLFDMVYHPPSNRYFVIVRSSRRGLHRIHTVLTEAMVRGDGFMDTAYWWYPQTEKKQKKLKRKAFRRGVYTD